MNDNIESNTPYDDVYRTMYVECDELVLPLLNEVFHEKYRGNERIIRRGNEHYDMQQGGAEEKRITDSFLEVEGEKKRRYHMECESSKDGSILIRMFQYGSQLAVEDAKIVGNELQVEFPNAAILFLRSDATTPDQMKICIRTPDGDVSYDIPTMKIKMYSIDDIFDKKLYFLIPFYVFNLEDKLEQYENDKRKLEELKEMYVNILDRLDQKVSDGELMALSRETIKDLSNKVVQNLAKKYKQVRKGIGDIMGGKVLDLEAIRIWKEGRNEGRYEGRNEGRAEIVLNMLQNKKKPEEVAELTGLSLEEVEMIKKSSLQLA